MYNFDASAVIDLWDNYPIQNPNFQPLWDWFEGQVNQGNFVISDVAKNEAKNIIIYKKIKKENPESTKFIKSLGAMKTYKKQADDLIIASKIKSLLGIEEDNYGKGIGENDLLIIAIAKRTNTILVTNEARQKETPKDKSNYKIPAVCNLKEVEVKNTNLKELLHSEW